MADIEKYQTKYADCLRKVVPEPIERVAFFGRPGHIRTDLLRLASPLASSIAGRGAAEAAGGLPHRFVAALTATSIYLVDYKPKGMGLKAKGAPAVWRRDQVRFSAPEGTESGSPVVVDVATGEQIQLENQILVGFGGEFNRVFLDRTASPVLPAPPAAVA